MDNSFINPSITCPICGSHSVINLDPQAGDAYFIASIDSKSKEIFATQGICAKALLCQSCGNIQLKAFKAN